MRGVLSVEQVEPEEPVESNPERDALLEEIKDAAIAAGVDLGVVSHEWAESHDGQYIAEATDLGGLELLRDDLRTRAA
jgi:hypothetical protein